MSDVPAARVPEVVFSPEVPDKDRRRLMKSPKALIAAGRATPESRADLSRKPGESVGIIIFGGGMLTGVWFLARLFFYAVLPDGMAVWLSRGLGVILVLMFISMVFGSASESDVMIAARKHHGKYLVPEDFDEQATGLMLRTQDAARAVRDAEVTKRGLLDEIRNDVVLPELLWDIGWLLHEQSTLRARQQEIAGGMVTAELEAVLGPQRQALKRSEDAVERKVEMLEQYAEQVRVADAALRAEQALEDGDRYIELLARTETTGQGELIQDLTDDAARLRVILARSIEAARETGKTLALPRD